MLAWDFPHRQGRASFRCNFVVVVERKKNFFSEQKKDEIFLEVCMSRQNFVVVGRQKKFFLLMIQNKKKSHMSFSQFLKVNSFCPRINRIRRHLCQNKHH